MPRISSICSRRPRSAGACRPFLSSRYGPLDESAPRADFDVSALREVVGAWLVQIVGHVIISSQTVRFFGQA